MSIHERILRPDYDASKVDSVVLRRLIEEVRYEKSPEYLLYDRVHNRHNRGSDKVIPEEKRKELNEGWQDLEKGARYSDMGYDRVHNRHNRGR